MSEAKLSNASEVPTPPASLLASLEPPHPRFETPEEHRDHAHQFDDAEQQHHASTLGMWAFLCTEVLFFGALFFAYTVYRWRYPAAFYEGSRLLAFWLGSLNTAVLLCSSFAMALAVHAAATGHRKNIVRFLLLTMALGLTFLCIKAVEYGKEYSEGLLPHFHFTHDFGELKPADTQSLAAEPKALAPPVDLPGPPSGLSPAARHIELFFCFYFVMTGLHATHMIIGIVIMGILARKAHKGEYTPDHFNPIEITGLYWHFVDIVWVFLYPLLYLLIQR